MIDIRALQCYILYAYLQARAVHFELRVQTFARARVRMHVDIFMAKALALCACACRLRNHVRDIAIAISNAARALEFGHRRACARVRGAPVHRYIAAAAPRELYHCQHMSVRVCTHLHVQVTTTRARTTLTDGLSDQRVN